MMINQKGFRSQDRRKIKGQVLHGVGKNVPNTKPIHKMLLQTLGLRLFKGRAVFFNFPL